MKSPWWGECWRFTGALLLALLFGYMVGHVVLILVLALAAMLVWQMWNIYHFTIWLQKGRKAEIPSHQGVWGDVYYQVYRLRSRQRKTAERLANLLERYKALAAALPDGAVVLARDHSIEWMNKAASGLLALDRKADIGQPIDNLIRQPAFTAYLRSGDYHEPIQLLSPATDEYMLQLYIVPYGQDQHLLMARDITRLHKLEVMRRDFVANVSHELRTPLTVMSGYLETLLENNAGNDLLLPALQQMKQQTTRMNSLVEDLLLISRLETEENPDRQMKVDVPVMLNGLLIEARSLSAERQHAISLDVDKTLCLLAVESDLHSAFANLVRNALQYTPDRGEITIRWYRDENGAHFEVRDSGIGIAPHLIPRLTERFYRVDTGRSRAVGGTGLGLAIVNHVLKNHDATLRVESRLGQGSLFACDFPVSRISDC